MEALSETRKMNILTFRVPAGSQTTFLRTMAKNMGWEQITQKPKKTRLQRSIEAAHKGPLYRFDSVEEMMEHLMSDED